MDLVEAPWRPDGRIVEVDAQLRRAAAAAIVGCVRPAVSVGRAPEAPARGHERDREAKSERTEAHPLTIANYSLSASAPPMISISSFVIAAWRARLYCSVRRPIISFALRVAASIAVMRAPSSLAWLSRSAR